MLLESLFRLWLIMEGVVHASERRLMGGEWVRETGVGLEPDRQGWEASRRENCHYKNCSDRKENRSLVQWNLDAANG